MRYKYVQISVKSLLTKWIVSSLVTVGTFKILFKNDDIETFVELIKKITEKTTYWIK